MVPYMKTWEKKAFFEWLLECDDRLTTETSIYGTEVFRAPWYRWALFAKPIKCYARNIC